MSGCFPHEFNDLARANRLLFKLASSPNAAWIQPRPATLGRHVATTTGIRDFATPGRRAARPTR